MSDEELTKNILAVFDTLDAKFGKGSQNIRSAYIKKTMGPSIRVEGA